MTITSIICGGNVLGLTRVKGVIVVGKLDQLIPTMGKRHAIMEMHIPAR
jgi:hypothetical protein